MNLSRISLASLLPLLAFSAPAAAQTLCGLEAGGSVREWAGPPGALGYPSAFPGTVFNHVVGPCPVGPVAAPASIIGDIGTDQAADTTWVTDGANFGEFDRKGSLVRSFTLPVGMIFPGPVTGLGIDSASSKLWITSGGFFASIAPPALNCVPPIVVDPPMGFPFFANATDIDWDPGSGTLWVSDDNGFVTNLDPTTGLPGPFGAFFAGGGPCGLGALLQGIAVDRAASAGALFVTDGGAVKYVDFAGLPAPNTFYAPANCYALPGAPVMGLTFSSRAIDYGAPQNVCDACPAPVLLIEPQTFAGQTVTIEIQGGNAGGDLPFLFFDSIATPPIPVLGGTLLQGMAFNIPMPAFSPGACIGSSAISGTVPGAVGVSLMFQGIVISGGGTCLKTTQGVEFTISAL